MSTENGSFNSLMNRARDGDQTAWKIVVERYSNAIRRVVRRRLKERSVRQQWDSDDFVQMAWGDLWHRVHKSRCIMPSTPDELIGLLGVIADRRVTDYKRRLLAQCRDVRKEKADAATVDGIETDSAIVRDESSVIASFAARLQDGSDFAAKIEKRLRPDEWTLIKLRCEGRKWHDIATELGKTPEATRSQFRRICVKMKHQLSLR